MAVCAGPLWVKLKATDLRVAPRSWRVLVRFCALLSIGKPDSEPRFVSVELVDCPILNAAPTCDDEPPLIYDCVLLDFFEIGSCPLFDVEAPLIWLPSEHLGVSVGLRGVAEVVVCDNFGADSMFNHIASEMLLSFLVTQFIDRLKRTFDAVRQLCAPPTSRDKQAVCSTCGSHSHFVDNRL